MKNAIIEKLLEIEQKENVRILHAVESGSRAWGFESPDSDYDVRFIYVRDVDFYLRLGKTKDVIEWQLDEVFDVNGWDLQKALRLLHSSNPTLFEWNNSPIVYKTTEEWGNIKEEINKCFSAKSGLYHYLNTAKSNYREYLKGEMVRLKKYFYVIRPILACKWILEKNSPPPVLFEELMNAVLEPELKGMVENLIETKMKTPEIGEGKKIEKLNEYIEENLITLKIKIDEFSNEYEKSWNKLDDIFLKIVK